MGTTSTVPGSDLEGYLRAYTMQMAFGDEDPAVVVDRYHVPDVEWFSGGLRLDRDRLIAHAAPVRKNAVACELDMHAVLVTDDRVAARYTMHATMRKNRSVHLQVYLFGRLADDGRLRQIHQLTRPVDAAGES
jgi:hypothetical protein